MFTSFLIGNGLGLSINAEYFSLPYAVKTIFSGSELSKEDKQRIIQLCQNNIPSQESEFETLQKTVWSCKNLQKYETEIKWLTEDARKLSESFDRLKHYVSKHFFDYYKLKEECFSSEQSSFQIFCRKFKDFIKDDNINSHIFTLNYDSLLYNEFLQDEDIFNGYDGKLIDGLMDSGFSSHALERKFARKFGYYLHLHGSPIVFENLENKNILKTKYDKNNKEWNLSDHISKHIVLTHERLKTTIIDESILLRTYWNYFQKSLSETSRLIIIGYSGNDTHINGAISRYLPHNSTIIIIQREGSEKKEPYWSKKLAYLKQGEEKEKKINILRYSNILDWDFNLEKRL